MTNRLIIFGNGDIAELAHFYFRNDSQFKVAAFTVDGDYLKESSFCGLPNIPFEEIGQAYAAAECHMFVALSYAKLNMLRKEKFLAARAKGYNLASYVSSRASVLNEGRVGDNCFILEDNTIQPFVTIGDNVTLWSGNHIGHHVRIADHTFIASHVVVSGGVDIGESCFIGVNATLRDHIVVGDKCVIGAGSLILTDAPPEGVYIGDATGRSTVPSTRLRRI